MWDEIVEQLSSFPSAVLTGVDANGYPFSIRCQPAPDHSRQRLSIEIPPGAPLQPGPASLLVHSFNELMWDLQSFLVRGRLEEGEGAWIFQPLKTYNGAVGGPVAAIKKLRHSRKVSTRYLEKRGLSRPKVPWDEYKRLWAEAKQE